MGSETPELRARVALDSPGHGPSTPAAEQSLHAEHSAERRPNGTKGGGADHASQPVEEVRAGAALPASGERDTFCGVVAPRGAISGINKGTDRNGQPLLDMSFR